MFELQPTLDAVAEIAGGASITLQSDSCGSDGNVLFAVVVLGLP
jgi:hypothetical protein